MRRVNAGYRSRDPGFGGRSVSSAGPVTNHQSRVTGHELPDTSSPWRVGQSVTHPKFGAGVIVNAEGRGADARVQVNFKSGGLKWLMIEYAKLAPA
jgi:PcrA/UvrD helicase-like protein